MKDNTLTQFRHPVLEQSIRRIALSICLLSFALPAAGQSKPIEIEQSRMQPSIQMARPIPSWWDVKILGSALMEGRLEFRLYNIDSLVATTTTEELALTGPEQRIRVMLPPVEDLLLPIEQLKVRIRFVGKKLTQDLGEHILRVATARQRTFMMLVPNSRLVPKNSPERSAVISRFKFASLAPADLDEDVKTVENSLEPNDLPQEPMSYCAYELVLLFGDEFRQMKKPYLDALAAWVRAGGSLYVEPTGVLSAHHLEFLRNLTSTDPRSLVIQTDSTGRLIPGTVWEDERIFQVSSSLGRIVLRVDEERPDASFETPAWRRAAAFLWRLHAPQVEAITRIESVRLLRLLPYGWFPTFDGNGNVIQSNVAGDANVGVPFQNTVQNRTLMPGGWPQLRLRTSTSELVDRLMPDGVQMVPLWVLGLILVSFVFWIGPIDYFVLGRLKARKYTWLTFPLATIFVTAFTVWITNRYMSSAETRRALVVRDVGDDGSIVRTNRFELLFIASSRTVATDVRKGVFTPLATSTSMVDDQMGFQAQQMFQRRVNGRTVTYGNPRSIPTSERSLFQTEGRIPTEFAATQNMAKWTPQLNRVFSIPGAKDETVVDWNALTAAVPFEQMFQTHTIAGELSSRVLVQFGDNAMAACIGQNGRWAYDRKPEWTSSLLRSHPEAVTQMYLQLGQQDYFSNSARLPNEIIQQADLFRWIYQHSVAMPYGMFGLLSSIGPTGGAMLDDLPILDAFDANQVLLIVVVPRGDEFIAYRKLVRNPETRNNGQ